MWQKCWTQNANLMADHGGGGGGRGLAVGMRYRERGPMKSWRPETMAEVGGIGRSANGANPTTLQG